MKNVQTVLLHAMKLSGYLSELSNSNSQPPKNGKEKKKNIIYDIHANISYFKGLIDFQNKTF